MDLLLNAQIESLDLLSTVHRHTLQVTTIFREAADTVHKTDKYVVDGSYSVHSTSLLFLYKQRNRS